MTGKPETVSEYPASLVVAMLRAYQTSDDFRWCDQSWRTAFLQVQCRMNLTIPQSLKANGELMARGLTRSC